MRKIFPVCCAWANAQSAKSMVQSNKNIRAFGILEYWKNVLNRIAHHSIIPLFHHAVSSSDHLIRSCQHVRRNREADLFGRFQIDDKFKLRWLFHGKIRRLSAL
jgi:hypothetical protein